MTTRFISAVILGLASGLAAFNTQAQSYAIDWFTVDGGGGTSTGSVYSVSGSIGQPDSGVLTGGDYGIEGGFWSFVSLVQSPGAPLLSIERLGTGLRVFWPRPATDFVLEWSPAVGTGAVWAQVPFPYTTNATEISQSVPSPAGNRFYRLRK